MEGNHASRILVHSIINLILEYIENMVCLLFEPAGFQKPENIGKPMET